MLEAVDTTEKNHQLPALIGGIPIFAWFANLWIEDLCFKQAFVEAFHLDFSVYRCCEQGTLEETNAVAEKTRGLSSDVLRCEKQVAKHLMTAPKMRPKYQIGWNEGNISVISTVCTSQINLTIQFRTGRWLWLLGIGFLHRFWDSLVESWRVFSMSPDPPTGSDLAMIWCRF